MKFREITIQDIPAIFEVQIATGKNNFTYEELETHRSTFELVEDKLRKTYKGWLCEIENNVVGFVIADKKTAEIWAIEVLPEYINLRIDTKLLNLADHWLISCGKKKFWLTCDTDKKRQTYSFNSKNGWYAQIMNSNILYTEKSISGLL